MSHPPVDPRRGSPSRRPPQYRSGVTTVAGTLCILYGLIVGGAGAAGTAWGLSDFADWGWVALFGPFVMALGVGLVRNGRKFLAGDLDADSRLTRLLMMPTTLAGIAIGGMVAQADLSTGAAQRQLAGFVTTFVLSVVTIVLVEAG
ncbi:hypothetical protein [Embleya hyalina]|uniref:Uncharacterized protein n=1 Tax=Embleya hyalina TaxID=516124 RepID=A0A401YMA1_9ACTN|nr:hypothetical protein [Embleya hyalina]GCD95740.1 hypothetical protein EHYA_03423 [Embleya hyalina]